MKVRIGCLGPALWFLESMYCVQNVWYIWQGWLVLGFAYLHPFVVVVDGSVVVSLSRIFGGV